MAFMMSMPRENYLKILYQIFAFLKAIHNGVIVFDPTKLFVYDSQFKYDENWSTTSYSNC